MDRHMLKALESRYGYDRDVHETTLLATVAKPNVCLDRSGQRPAPHLSRPGSTGRDGFATGPLEAYTEGPTSGAHGPISFR